MKHANATSRAAALLFVATLFSSTAWAAFRENDPPPTPTPSYQLVGYTPVTQVGSGVATPVEGLGKDVPLPQAMQMLMPPGWSYAPASDVTKPLVSWDKSPSWVNTLSSVAAINGLRFLVDWQNHIVYAELQPANGSDKDNAGKVVNVQQPNGSDLAWTLQPGGLKDQFSTWAQRAGYTIWWPDTMPDIQVQVQTTIHGDFLEAVKTVVESLQAHGSNLVAHAFPENVPPVVVFDKR